MCGGIKASAKSSHNRTIAQHRLTKYSHITFNNRTIAQRRVTKCSHITFNNRTIVQHRLTKISDITFNNRTIAQHRVIKCNHTTFKTVCVSQYVCKCACLRVSFLYRWLISFHSTTDDVLDNYYANSQPVGHLFIIQSHQTIVLLLAHTNYHASSIMLSKIQTIWKNTSIYQQTNQTIK